MGVCKNEPVAKAAHGRMPFNEQEWNEQRNELSRQTLHCVPDIDLDSGDYNMGEPSAGGFAPEGRCLQKLCAAFGVAVPRGTTCVSQISDALLLSLRQSSSELKVFYEFYSRYDARNHVFSVRAITKSARIEVEPFGCGMEKDHPKTMGVTSAVKFFNKSDEFFDIQFFADGPTSLPNTAADAQVFGSESIGGGRRGGPRSESVVDDRAKSGGSNVAGGVKRAKRRVIASRSKFSPDGHVAKSYSASTGVRFNNLNEMFQDCLSREYAQEIIESVFQAWGVPGDEPDALKYAEDLILAFFIATTASNKADYEHLFDVPVDKGEVDGDFGVLSKVLAEQYGVTRRQFARAVADDMRRYIKEPENVHLRQKLADRAGCDPQMAELAFDGSTHCTGLTSAQLTFTKLLENRNLFENEELMSQGASQSIMEGVHGRVRSKVQR